MGNFIAGTIFGIIVSTIGFSGVARVLDTGVDKTKVIVEKLEKDTR